MESQLLQGKLILVGEDGKPLKPFNEASSNACTNVVRETFDLNSNATPSVNMTEEGKNKQNKGKNGLMRTTVVLVPTRNQSWNVGSMTRLVTSKEIAVV
ncbi:hypothetical protein Tco_0376170, partial [Tanacetum coccineum]